MREMYRPGLRYTVEGTMERKPLHHDSGWRFIIRCRTLWGARVMARRVADSYRHVRVIDHQAD